jgi:hypothetical protein
MDTIASPLVKTVVVKRDDAVNHQMMAVTPSSDTPNVIVQPMNMLAMIAVRALRVYFNTVIGIMGIAQFDLDKGVLPNDFVSALQSAAGMAIGASVMSAIWNTGELLARIDEKFPKMRA